MIASSSDRNFLATVQQSVTAHPEVGAHVSDFVARGIEDARREALHRATDMEAALAMVLAKRHSTGERFVLEVLHKWRGKSALKWDGTIESLEARMGQNKEIKNV